MNNDRSLEPFLGRIVEGDNVATLRQFPDDCVDLTVTSPPYDTLRTYGGLEWDFDALSAELLRVTKTGGVVVWIVNDQIVDGDQSGTSFEQALAFKRLGFKLWQTMIWAKPSFQPGDGRFRYHDAFEFMFVLAKGRPRTTNIIRDVPSTNPGGVTRTNSDRRRNEKAPTVASKPWVRPEFSFRTNVWSNPTVANSGDEFALNHPAAFPEGLVRDHVLTWSTDGDVILDPFAGSGTTCRVAKDHARRFIGIERNPEFVELARRRLAQQVLGF